MYASKKAHKKSNKYDSLINDILNKLVKIKKFYAADKKSEKLSNKLLKRIEQNQIASNKQLVELNKFLQITITSILDMNTKASKKSSRKTKSHSIANVIRNSFKKLQNQAPYKVEFKMINQAAHETNSVDKYDNKERNRPHVEPDEQFFPVDNYLEEFEENSDESVEYEPP